MAKGLYIGKADAPTQVGRVMIGVDGVAKEVKEAYVGVNGVAKCIGKARSESGGTEVVKATNAPNASKGGGHCATAKVGEYMIFVGGGAVNNSYYSNQSTAVVYNTVEAYTHNLVKTSTTASVARCASTGCNNSTHAFIIGGNGVKHKTSISACDIFDANLLRTTITLSSAYYGRAAGNIGEKIIAAGGCNHTATSTNSNYSVAQLISEDFTVTTITALSTARGFSMCQSTNDKIYIAGGCTAYNAGSSVVNTYDSDGVRNTITSLSSARSTGASSYLGGKIIFAGGAKGPSVTTSTSYNTVDCYDENSVHSTISSLSVSRCSTAFTTTDNFFFIGGGSNSNTTYNTVDLYDKELTRINKLSLSTKRTHSSGQSDNGVILIFCGVTERGTVGTTGIIKTVEVFTEKDLTKYYFD